MKYIQVAMKLASINNSRTDYMLKILIGLLSFKIQLFAVASTSITHNGIRLIFGKSFMAKTSHTKNKLEIFTDIYNIKRAYNIYVTKNTATCRYINR